MQTGEGRIPAIDESMRRQGYGIYNPVTVHMEDTVGVVFLGILALALLIALLRALERNRVLMTQLPPR
jgi:hypothetical protein